MEEAVSRGEPELDPPFDVIEPGDQRTPIVFDSPHSGSCYPRSFLRASRLDSLTLRRSEDAFVDELFAPCVAIGAPLLRARFPRAFLDVNREPFELDPHMFDGRLPDFANTRSLRVAAGLGVIPRVVGDAQPIYRAALSVDHGLARIAALHRPYHARLSGLLERARARFGIAILLDCHSMPSASADVGGCDIVLGDRFGSSAAGWIVDALEQSLRDAGLVVRRNKPYAGGYITEHYGAPNIGRHAVQIEINRALYMDERAIRKLEKAESLARALAQMALALALRVQGLGGACLAAE
jgi:N-formylglutamate amidohydrolase